MTKIPFALHPHLLGFENLQAMLEKAAVTENDSYPPYNIEQRDACYRISIAVAGFAKNDLSVTIEGNLLKVCGMRIEQGEQSFVHKGIGSRKFERSFILARCIEVKRVIHENGLLNIDLERNLGARNTQNIPINTLE